MDDLISRQMAIKELESGKDKKSKGEIGGFYNQIIENDIEKLKKLPSAQPERKTKFVKLTVRDSNGRPFYSIIYLEDGNEFEGYSSYSLDVISDYLKRYFEFAQPEPNTGRWIDDNCSECGQYVYHGDVRNFCPNCGAKMLKEDEGK